MTSYKVQTIGITDWFNSCVNPWPDGFRTREEAAEAIRGQLSLPNVERGFRIVEIPEIPKFNDGTPVPDDSEAPAVGEIDAYDKPENAQG